MHVYRILASGLCPILVQAPDLISALEAFETHPAAAEVLEKTGDLVVLETERVSDHPVMRHGIGPHVALDLLRGPAYAGAEELMTVTGTDSARVRLVNLCGGGGFMVQAGARTLIVGAGQQLEVVARRQD